MSDNKLTPELQADIQQWVRVNGLKHYGGATVISLCKHFGFTPRSFERWMKKPAFADAVAEAQKYFVENLEHELVTSLAKSATGYKWVKRKTEYTSDKNGNPVIKKQTTEDVEVPPNVGAAIFLLTNIAPERWQNKQQQQNDITGSLALDVNVVNDKTPDIATSENEVDA